MYLIIMMLLTFHSLLPRREGYNTKGKEGNVRETNLPKLS